MRYIRANSAWVCFPTVTTDCSAIPKIVFQSQYAIGNSLSSLSQQIADLRGVKKFIYKDFEVEYGSYQLLPAVLKRPRCCVNVCVAFKSCVKLLFIHANPHHWAAMHVETLTRDIYRLNKVKMETLLLCWVRNLSCQSFQEGSWEGFVWSLELLSRSQGKGVTNLLETEG